MKVPQTIGPIHFIGIGGIGMSGIAEMLVALGYQVQGSDLADNANVTRLREKGVRVYVGHDAKHIDEAQVVVISSAIGRDNPELREARMRLLPIVRRAEMLAELMRFKSCVAVAGTHGKTTTTSMVAALLEAGGFDPTVINGGIINAYGTNARMGTGDWMVVEADESDGTFVKLPADVAIVTNVDPEHLDHYGDFAAVQDAFRAFVENIPFYGFSVMCLDHPQVQTLVRRIEDKRLFTYGTTPQADVQILCERTQGPRANFSLKLRDRYAGTSTILEDLNLPMPGHHNVLNATAAACVAHHLGVDDAAIRSGLSDFAGVKRRFSLTGTWRDVSIFDDYAHHPVEISAVLAAAREACSGRIIAIMQPHRYTRLASLFDDFCGCFQNADKVLITPVYEAGEAPIAGADHQALVRGIRAGGHRDAQALDDPRTLANIILETARAGDYVLFLGAGSISQWAHALPEELAALPS